MRVQHHPRREHPLPQSHAGTSQRPSAGPGAACPAEVSWQFPPDPVHAGRARSWLAAWLAETWTDGDAAYFATLAFSEVCTNCLLHGRGPVTVTAHLDPDALVCQVTDRSDDLPALHGAADTDEHHRGLQLLAVLTDGWVARPLPTGGKTVSFTVNSHPRAGPGARRG